MMPSSMMPALVPLDIAALAVLVCLAIGGVLLALGSLVPATAPQARPLWPVYGTELVIVGGGLGPFVAGGLVLSMALAGLAVRVAYEAVSVAWRRHLRAGGTAGTARLAGEVLLFPGLPLALFVAVGIEPANAGVLVLAFLLVETYDSYALFGGKLFGRHPAFPRLSPRKTVEGLAIGAAMLALTAAVAGPPAARLVARPVAGGRRRHRSCSGGRGSRRLAAEARRGRQGLPAGAAAPGRVARHRRCLADRRPGIGRPAAPCPVSCVSLRGTRRWGTGPGSRRARRRHRPA